MKKVKLGAYAVMLVAKALIFIIEVLEPVVGKSPLLQDTGSV